MNEERRLAIDAEGDIVTARQVGREMASTLGFGLSDLTLIATAISEITRNIVEHAGRGELEIKIENNGTSAGIAITARDNGPGIEDLDLAMEDGYTSKNGLGLGLPGSQRIMDEFVVESTKGAGTAVLMKKWKR
ncbi:MAG: anti-sigma regulatory factor [Candidatus Geothermincolia bacterium]